MCWMIGWKEASQPPSSLFPRRVCFLWLVSQGLLARSGIVWAVSQEDSPPFLVARWALMGYSIKQQTALEAPSAQELTQITLLFL